MGVLASSRGWWAVQRPSQRKCSALRPARRSRAPSWRMAAEEGSGKPPGSGPPPPPAVGGPAEEPPPGPEQEEDLQIPREVIQHIRSTVFGYGQDGFFATSVENFEANGVLFKGNLRGDPAKAYAKLSARLQEELGWEYSLFLLSDQEEHPVAVVLPTEAAQVQVAALPEALLAVVFGATTVATTLNVNAAGALFNAALLTINPDPQLLMATLPGTAAFFAVLGAHEVGHIVAARQRGLELGPPLLIPAGLGLLGSFGAITRIKSPMPNRDALTSVAVAGPLAGTAMSLVLLLAGLALTKEGVGAGIQVDTASFRESLLVGGLGQAVLGDRLFLSDAVDVSPVLVAGWSGLIIQSLNVLPAGELDGGRLALGLWGRRTAGRISTLALFLLGLAGFSSNLALFWLLLVVTLQRGPIVPCNNELSGVTGGAKRAAAIAMLLLPLLVLLPFPLPAVDGLSGAPPIY